MKKEEIIIELETLKGEIGYFTEDTIIKFLTQLIKIINEE